MQLEPAPAHRPRTLYPVLAVAAVVLAAIGLIALLGDDGGGTAPGAPGATGERLDPLAYRPENDDDYTARATTGYSHVLYARSPGGVMATAQRVERFRALVEQAAGDGDVVDADTLEAIVFLESAGRPEVIAGGRDPVNAAGLTQIVAETGQALLGMQIDLERSRALTRTANRAGARRRPAAQRRALALRRRVDERFDPAKALAATVRYLRIARDRFGRDDLAVVSYHMGIGNLERVIGAYGGEERPPYVRLFFDTSPVRNAAAWRILSSLGDDSSTYLWRVQAAKEIMRLWREDRGTLGRRDELQTNKASAEEVLHPSDDTSVFGDPGALDDARKEGALVELPRRPAALGFRIDRRMGELAGRVDAEPSDYRALRPEALRLAQWTGAQVRRISGVATPLTMSSAVRDQHYQDLLVDSNPEATSEYSLHTTGYAFDVLRRYRSRSQAVAFQFLLDRLQALNLIAWVREAAAIHMTASSETARLPGPG